MVKFEKREGEEYVVREGVTADDPVGAYILKRWEDNPNSKTRFEKSGKAVSYSDILDDFESGKMTRARYEAILDRIEHVQTPLAVITQRREQRSFRDGALARLVFGDKGEAPEVLDLSKNWKEGVCAYVLERIEGCPDLFDHRNNIRAAAKAGSLKKLEKAIGGYWNSILFDMSHGQYFDFLRGVGHRDLAEEFYDAQKRGFAEFAKAYAKVDAAVKGARAKKR